jgi:hypothetical protein
MAWFIYVLCDPRIDDPIKRVRYVGAAQDAGARLKTHIVNRAKHHSHISCWLRMMVDKEGIKPAQEIVDAGPEPWGERIWAEYERKWIAHYRAAGADLCNLTTGGESGYAYLPEVGAKISKALKSNDQAWRKKQAATLKRMWADGTFNPKFGARTQRQIESSKRNLGALTPDIRSAAVAKSVAVRSIPIEVVRIILTLRESGLSYSKIAKELQRLEIPTKKGGEWRMESVAYVCVARAKYKDIL